MKIILLSSAVLMILFLLTGSVLAFINHDIYVVGGKYIVHDGELISGNLKLVFAQATLEEGSHIDGDILAFSSCLDLHGTVVGKISSIESDVRLEKSAEIKGLDQDKGVFPYVVLLPEMVRWYSALGR